MKKTVTAGKEAATSKTAEKTSTEAKKTVKKAAVKKTVPPEEKKSESAVNPEKTHAKKTAVKKVVKEKPHKKLKLTKAMQKHYIGLLTDLRQDYSNQFSYHKQEVLSSKKDSAGERAGMATHMADLGSDNFRHDIELGLLSDEGDVLAMIDEALQRIKDSEYGVCVECGCEIHPERLDAKPYARFCTACKAHYEQIEDPSRRHR